MKDDMPTSTSRTIRDAQGLVDSQLIAPEAAADIAAVLQRYALAITPAVVETIATADPVGGVAKQYLPDVRENSSAPGELDDPIGDATHSPVKGVIHRHKDRVLLNLLQNCAVYCRFCFRRENVGPHIKALKVSEIEAALAYVRGNQDIWEVILSGGDPLMLPPAKIADVAGALVGIEHVGVMRIHTRVPAVAPDRISDELIEALSVMVPTYVVIHVNHPDELTDAFKAACAKLANAGVPMLSQSVLLKDINDDAETLTRLFRRLVECRVKPYYLHHLDKARGTSHFRTTLQAGQELMRELRGDVSGLCQPAYVLDIPGGYGKVPVGPRYIADDGDGGEPGCYCVMDPGGRTHNYTDE